jgi:hypothetical protein
MADQTTAWLCRWDGAVLLVWASTIEQARLNARRYAGPNTPVAARLATRQEIADPALNVRDEAAS